MKLTCLALLLICVSPQVPAAATARNPTCFGAPATIVGTPGDDAIVGTRRDDVIVSGRGGDQIRAWAGNDLICTGRGHDGVLTHEGICSVEGSATIASGAAPATTSSKRVGGTIFLEADVGTTLWASRNTATRSRPTSGWERRRA